jgi:hypothetical protein
MNKFVTICLLTLLATAASADDAPKGEGKKDAGAPTDAKKMTGISILGNQEAPKSLVIVPWKSSMIGDGVGISRALDTKPKPVDRDVFARELSYYRIKSNSDTK